MGGSRMAGGGRVTAAVVAVLLTLPAGRAVATTAGEVDEASGGGMRTVSLSPYEDHLADIAVQQDGKVVTVGWSVFPPPGGFPEQRRGGWSVARLLEDGALDTSFNGTGSWLHHLGDHANEATSVVVQPDGKLVVAGWRCGYMCYTSQSVLVRLLPDGSFDPSFDGDGIVVVPTTGLFADSRTYDVALREDGRIVLVGAARVGGAGVAAVAQLLPDGRFDPTFGTDGQVKVSAEEGAGARAVHLDEAGRVVLAGTASRGGYEHVLVARLDPAGTPDTTFGVDGRAVAAAAQGHHEVRSVAVQPDGGVVVSGRGPYPSRSGVLMAMRLTPNGAMDGGFGTDGFVLADDIAHGYHLVASATTITVVGTGETASVAVLRLRNDGGRDETFGQNGKVELVHAGLAGRAIASDGSGALVVAGHNSSDLGSVRLAALSSCTVTLDVPNVVGPDTLVEAVAAFADAAGRAVRVDGHEIVIAAHADGAPSVQKVAASDAEGRARAAFDLAPGQWSFAAVFEGSDTYERCESQPIAMVVKAATSLRPEPVVSGGDPSASSLPRMAATLTSDGSGLAGRTVTFSAGDQTLCSGTTDQTGRASCIPTNVVPELVASGYDARFAGDELHEPSTARGTFLG